MGYTTDFSGSFDLDKKLTDDQAKYLFMFSGTRRMKRDPKKLVKDPNVNKECLELLKKLNFDIGHEADLYCGDESDMGQDQIGVIDYNNHPTSQPSLWCQWVPTSDLKGIEWDSGENFYEYIKWIEYIIKTFLKPWKLKLNGKVTWYGESSHDTGKIIINNNNVTIKEGKIIYE
jgi:hypothetical protein